MYYFFLKKLKYLNDIYNFFLKRLYILVFFCKFVIVGFVIQINILDFYVKNLFKLRIFVCFLENLRRGIKDDFFKKKL